MKSAITYPHAGRNRAAICLLLLCFSAAAIAGCGGGDGGGKPRAASALNVAEGAEVGKTLSADGWVVTLVEAPEQRKEVGSGDVDTVSAHYEQYGFTSVVSTEGWWLIVGLEVTNDTGDMALVPSKLLKVTDAQDREYLVQGKMMVFPVIWTDERWMKEENYLFSDAVDDGVTLTGPLVYDIAADATGLTLVMKGTDETIDLGF